MFSVVERRLFVERGFEFSQPPVDVCTLERGAGDVWVLLVVAAGSAVTALTAKNLLDEPAVGQHLKALLFCMQALDDVQRDTALLLDLAFKALAAKALAAKATVGVNDLHMAPPGFVFDVEQQRQSTHPLIQVGRQHDGIQEVTAFVTQTHALAPADFLGSIITTRPPFSVVLTLWVSMTAAVGRALRP